jgi:hypothetical protein
MRSRLLQGVHVLFAKYVRLIGALWLFWLLVDIVLGLVVFPDARSGVWHVGLGGTIGCAIGMASVGILKAIFHKRVIQALDTQKGPNA